MHPSNFRLEGFTAAVDVADLATLGVPVVVDIGSGLLAPTRCCPTSPTPTPRCAPGPRWSRPAATAQRAAGGLVLGKAKLVDQLRRHPLAQALRVDKLTLASLEATLRGPVTPTWRALRADPDELRRRAGKLAAVPTRGSKPRWCRRTVRWVAAERRVWC